MKLYETLERQLKKEPNFVADNGDLKKWVILNKAQSFDEELIGLLLENDELKNKFFVNVKDVMVFNQNLFVQFLEQKNYLNDSYTQFKNKVGLTINGKLLKQNNDVALVWPFKDCVLEGGQTREEDKREEIFFNEILAQDEITQLLEPKVLTNAKRIDKDGETPLDKFHRNENGTITDNMIIKGNNLLASHSLKVCFKNSFKLVYLDPPYNTEGAANTFSYNNSFNHSSWLTFMRNRIQVAKELVKEDGFICLAIDDYEYAYLKVLCDDILGRDNFIATVVVQIKKEGRTDKEFFAPSHDYALFYCRNRSKAKLNKLPIDSKKASNWKEKDDVGHFKWRDFIRTGANSTPEERQNMDYIIYYSKDKKEIVGVGGYSEVEPSKPYFSNVVYLINEDGEYTEMSKEYFLSLYRDIVEISPKGSRGERQVWRWENREKVLWACKMGEISLIGNKIKIKDRIRDGSKPTTTWYDSDFNATSHGTLLLKKMFNGNKVFSYPKSLYTMIDIIQITTSVDSNDLVLDMFGGSGTTAHAVINTNNSDNGNRRFVIIEQMEYIENATLSRIKKCLRISDNIIFFELKIYNQIFIEQIEAAKDSETLMQIWEQMKVKSFLNYNIDIKKQDQHIEEFKALNLTEQKQHLCEILDKNQLYVNLSSLNDTDFACSEEEKKVTKDFYQIND